MQVMTPEQFKQVLQSNKEDIQRAIKRTIPVKVATTAQHHFRDNFQHSGFVDEGLKPWKRSKRQDDPKNPDRAYKTLHSRRDHLYKSVKKRTEPGKAIIYTDVPYAKAHNEGTNTAGRKHNVRIPKRQFMGKSKKLDEKCLQVIRDEFDSILNKH